MDGGDQPCCRPKRAEFERWRDEFPRGSDVEARRNAKPALIARAELELGLMERFSYPSLEALRAESSELLVLLEAESYGIRRDEQEELDEMKHEAEMRRHG